MKKKPKLYRIYADLQAGKNYTQILTGLTKDRIPSPKGRDIWSLSTVKEILTNVVYKGDYLYQKYFMLDTLEEKVATNKGELPQYYIVVIMRPLLNRRNGKLCKPSSKSARQPLKLVSTSSMRKTNIKMKLSLTTFDVENVKVGWGIREPWNVGVQVKHTKLIDGCVDLRRNIMLLMAVPREVFNKPTWSSTLSTC